MGPLFEFHGLTIDCIVSTSQTVKAEELHTVATLLMEPTMSLVLIT